MSSEFKPGDKVMVVNVPAESEEHVFNGRIGEAQHPCLACTIRDAIFRALSGGSGISSGSVWHVKIDGKDYSIHERYLRKIDDEDDSRKLGRWDECPWKPEEVIAC